MERHGRRGEDISLYLTQSLSIPHVFDKLVSQICSGQMVVQKKKDGGAREQDMA